MNINTIISARRLTPLYTLFIAALIILFLSVPAALNAQVGSQELGAAIRAALLSDTRSAQVAPAQFDALVAALTAEAIKQGLSVHDITWNRIAPMIDATSEGETCDSYLCALNIAFGFSGPGVLLPTLLGVSSGLLLLGIGLMLKKHNARND